MAMAEFTGCFLWVEEVGFYSGPMSVVAHAATLEHPRIVSMDFAKIVALMAIEAAAFEDETAAPA
jgi:hypothetical protein